MVKLIKDNWVLISILVFAFLVRMPGLFYGFPLLGVFTDETPTILSTLKMIGQFSWRVNFPDYYYPALLSYVYAPFFIIFLIFSRLTGLFPSLEAMKETAILNSGYFLPLARLINVILAVATVFLVYKIALKLFNKKQIGLIASWLLAASFFHSWQSHFTTTWIPQTFFIILAAYWAIVMWQKDKLTNKDYLIGGLAVGAAFGINFVGILSYVFFLLVHFWRNNNQGFVKKFFLNNKFWILNLTMICSLGLIYFLNPYGINNYLTRIIDTSIQGSSYQINETLISRMVYYLKALWYLELIYFLLFIPAIFLLFKKKKRIFLFLFGFMVIYFFCLSPLTGMMQRYLLPILPLMVIVIAYLIDWLSEQWLNKKYFRLILILLISGQALYLTLLFDTKVIQADTRLLAQEWIYKNIPANALINNSDIPKLVIRENKEVINLIEKRKPDLFSTKRKYLQNLSTDLYPYPSYYVVSYKDLAQDLINQFEYIIIGDFDFNNLVDKKKHLPKGVKKLKDFYPVNDLSRGYSNGQLDRNFVNPWQLKNIDIGGPYIEIYQID
jgi:4-amino-4-deoxy-L-arabinose transferase-like glycosyltransferase